MAGRLDHPERPVAEPQHRDGGVEVVSLGEPVIGQDGSPGVDLFHLAHQEAREVEVVHGHVQEQAAGSAQNSTGGGYVSREAARNCSIRPSSPVAISSRARA